MPLDLSDVVGRRSLDTGYGRVTVAASNATAALEVMSRIAVDPRWLLWLPSTMSPYSTSTLDSHLEQPVEALADLFTPPRRLACSSADPGAAAGWWQELTGAGGEGMVVTPLAGAPDGRVQPGVKCRGREYLRIIYGPDYTEPARPDPLHQRTFGRERSRATREHILGLAALDRVAGGEPLCRVHEMVFAIPATGSEPVDPRL